MNPWLSRLLKAWVVILSVLIIGGIAGSVFLELVHIEGPIDDGFVRYEIGVLEYKNCTKGVNEVEWTCNKMEYDEFPNCKMYEPHKAVHCNLTKMGQFGLIFSYIMMAVLHIILIGVILFARDRRASVYVSLVIIVYWAVVATAYVLLVFQGFDRMLQYDMKDELDPAVDIQRGIPLVGSSAAGSLVVFLICLILSCTEDTFEDPEEMYQLVETNDAGAYATIQPSVSTRIDKSHVSLFALTLLLTGCLCPLGPILFPIVTFWLLTSRRIANLMIGAIALLGTAIEWTVLAGLIFATIRIWTV